MKNETKSKTDRIHQGAQWPPLNLIHLGIRAFERRDSRNYRISSEALHSIDIKQSGSRIHNENVETAYKIIQEDGPCENTENLDAGSHLLTLEKKVILWRIPIWVGERISQMWKQQENVILRKMMEKKK